MCVCVCVCEREREREKERERKRERKLSLFLVVYDWNTFLREDVGAINKAGKAVIIFLEERVQKDGLIYIIISIKYR